MRRQLVRNMRLFEPSIKISTRQGDYSHQKITWVDRFWLYFATYEWLACKHLARRSSEPIVRWSKYTIYFKRKGEKR